MTDKLAIGQIGVLTVEIANHINLTINENKPIYLGKSNIQHMKASHPEDYAKYGASIVDILASPDYVGQNQKDGSIEYVKNFLVNNEFVKVAVRISTNNKYFARSIYVLNKKRVQNFIHKGTLVDLTNKQE